MQIILQATHGIVSGEPSFFKRAFGDTAQDYERILLTPHDYIFNRDWYERFDGRPEFDEYRAEARKLDDVDRVELLDLLSSCDPREFGTLPSRTTNRRLRRVLPFYVSKSKDFLAHIWERQRALTAGELTADAALPDDERVEDAGLDYEDVESAAVSPRRSTTSHRRAAA